MQIRLAWNSQKFAFHSLSEWVHCDTRHFSHVLKTGLFKERFILPFLIRLGFFVPQAALILSVPKADLEFLTLPGTAISGLLHHT